MKFYRWVFFSLFIFISVSVFAQIRLPRLVRDSMVLQRDKPIDIWGWASVGEKVEVKFNKKKYTTKADQYGKWYVKLAAMHAGGPFSMELIGKDKISLHDILIGDVWVCSGQSNMEHQLKLHSVYYSKEISTANNSFIRQFKVPNITDLDAPQYDLPSGNWKSVSPENVLDFSAVAYFFADALYQKYHVPIGLINATWGGSPIEAWMSEKSFQAFPKYKDILDKNKDSAYVNSRNRNAVQDALSKPKLEDQGLQGKWYDPNYTIEGNGWRNFAVPGYWEDQGIADLNGTVWFRRILDVPNSIASASAKVFLGRIVDADALYINGQEIGNTSYQYPQRRYSIPDGVLKPGKNVFVVKVTNFSGKGGFVPDKPYQLMGGGDTISLTGYWKYKVGNVFIPHRPQVLPAIALQNQPTALFNAMISPLVNYPIKGFVWYQGESNSGDAAGYAKMQPAMITDWRKKWKDRHLPFLFVQLPGYMDYHYLPTESGLALFREAQAQSLYLQNTAMATAIDLGEWNDIHPDRKKPVGERLAMAAEKNAYGENIIDVGPTFERAITEGNRLVVYFKNSGHGLLTNDGKAPAEFAIAGADKKFYWANAIIEGNKLLLKSVDVPSPQYVRYSWSDNPVNPNLINSDSLPAVPFRTDK